jgi:hypothetical protein
LLLAALLAALYTNPSHAQQTRDRWPDFKLLAQAEVRAAQERPFGFLRSKFCSGASPQALLPLSSSRGDQIVG